MSANSSWQALIKHFLLLNTSRPVYTLSMQDQWVTDRKRSIHYAAVSAIQFRDLISCRRRCRSVGRSVYRKPALIAVALETLVSSAAAAEPGTRLALHWCLSERAPPRLYAKASCSVRSPHSLATCGKRRSITFSDVTSVSHPSSVKHVMVLHGSSRLRTSADVAAVRL